MSPMSSFLFSLALTVLLLGAVVVTGRAAWRKTHLVLVVAALVSLGVSILFAVKLGPHYDLEAAGFITPLHRWLAKITVLTYLAPVATGTLLMLGKENMRRAHAWAAYVVLAITVTALVTGVMMILMARPI